MDPNATLFEIRDRQAAVKEALDGDGDLAEAADELVDLVKALDDWLTAGGFLPAAWGDRVSAGKVEEILSGTGITVGTQDALMAWLRKPVTP